MASTGDLHRYRVISTIGAGGMATVQLAEDTVLGREVALKRVSGEADVPGLTRLRREALVGASFSHVNLVSVYDVVTTEDGHLIIVMEYVEGETLRQVLTRHGRLPAAEALPILEGVAAGLDAINERGVVHRDVKPSNVLLGAGGAVKLADLGIASAPDRTRITTSGSVLGSLSYMAPEQLSDVPATRAIDVYALAAVTFEVLSGVKARREPNAVALAHAIATQGPPSLQDAWPRAPRGVDELLRRAMARDPAQRPRSAGELMARLRAVLEPEDTAQVTTQRVRPAPVVVPPRRADPVPPRRADPVPPRRVAPAPRRRARAGWLAAAALALAVVVAALVVVLTSGGSPARRPATAASTGRSRRHRTQTATHTTASRSTTSTRPGSTTPSSPASAAGDPVSAVKSFYTRAAAHDYATAWTLADPSMQAQLRGYGSFRSAFAAARSISFTSARAVTQTSSSARVAITTTSVRTTGTQHCAGTVDLVSAGESGQWQLHQIQINCS